MRKCKYIQSWKFHISFLLYSDDDLTALRDPEISGFIAMCQMRCLLAEMLSRPKSDHVYIHTTGAVCVTGYLCLNWATTTPLILLHFLLNDLYLHS